ncbi:hypothetical protein PIB30_088039 [Stylosanthes scabra]|uniref:Uncharacterized protein n=1 Tax=Stylosanthes scabra TaxID=79078 RepID=A0ABU6RUJ1_9FABA|nr:hypothetical protein [Stylosanthes scabra]
MPRSKRTSSKRQRESDDVVDIEPPPDHPLGRYFSRLDDLNHYVFNFYDSLEISPRVPKKKILCNVFNMEMRLRRYLINYVLIPRSTGHAHVQVDDVVAMWAMNNDIKIHWPYFIAQHMLSARLVAPQHVIDTTTLYHMGRGLQVQEKEAPPPPQEQEAGPSEQPSMRDMMEILQRMELNQQNMENRFQGFEQGQERMDRQFQRMNRRLQRIEQSMGIHQEEDEDQN